MASLAVPIKEANTSKESELRKTIDTSSNVLGQMKSGDIGANSSLDSLPGDTFIAGSDRHKFEKQFAPSGLKSLSGIALRSNLLGAVSASSLLTVFYNIALAPKTSTLWRIPFFMAVLSIFHFLEFYTTAYANTSRAQVSSFLLTSNGSAYNIAHATAIVECLLTNTFFPNRHWIPNWVTYLFIVVGLGMVIMGQFVRSLAIIQAGPSFNHVVQTKKNDDHKLVTHGVFGYCRHPSYFAFFWWALGSQLVLGNPISFAGYAVVLHKFFYKRIDSEERFLVAFFGDEYIQYRDKTSIGIPFIQ